jgi:hypothetical protein
MKTTPELTENIFLFKLMETVLHLLLKKIFNTYIITVFFIKIFCEIVFLLNDWRQDSDYSFGHLKHRCVH